MLSRKKILRSDNHELPDKPTLRSLSIDPMGDYPSKYDLGFRVRPQGQPKTFVDPDFLLTLPKKNRNRPIVCLFVCVESNVSLGLILRGKMSNFSIESTKQQQQSRDDSQIQSLKAKESKLQSALLLCVVFYYAI